jgi:hypothetical protein
MFVMVLGLDGPGIDKGAQKSAPLGNRSQGRTGASGHGVMDIRARVNKDLPGQGIVFLGTDPQGGSALVIHGIKLSTEFYEKIREGALLPFCGQVERRPSLGILGFDI